MPVQCKYFCGRVIDVDFKLLDQIFEIDTTDKYNLILIEKGNLNLRLNEEHFNYMAPCIVAIKENVNVHIISSHMLLAKLISFNVSFLNININYDLINSGLYENVSANYGFIPLNIFYETNNTFFGAIPLSTESLAQLQEHFNKFNHAITHQIDNRWSCRARLHLNLILELIHQIYTQYLNEKTAFYNIKDPNVWVSMILKKIHSDYRESISLITISEYIHINKTTVSRYFKAITGYTVTDYIINYRIKCACYSLATTSITLKELAVECGFQGEAYFIRQFTAKMGMSPTQYRRQCVDRRKQKLQ